ncbi:MotA/TolQ/ExbB proton channel family protein [Thiorhodospira sibirica]|uniref:MotA/TolQ/ExbB proton channel family protein n=1 Tax=Thiorhodospira sibirica TaxID=154347 RepID=UPI00022C173C|nr:MotA/TolQ/ExbB proton channel family protein [Thiorhodospira sibirica]
MFELVKAGGWLMIPIIACSILALAIVLERFWSLQRRRIIPAALVVQIWQWIQAGKLDGQRIQALRSSSPLGRVLAAGLINRHHPREIMKESIEESGRQVAHQLERFLNTLGTIAMITPLLGLLGTVVGMIQVFAVITDIGVGNPGELAGGISQALITTAAGISVAIPALIFHRYFRGRVDELVLEMEQEAIKLIEVLHGERETVVEKINT